MEFGRFNLRTNGELTSKYGWTSGQRCFGISSKFLNKKNSSNSFFVYSTVEFQTRRKNKCLNVLDPNSNRSIAMIISFEVYGFVLTV